MKTKFWFSLLISGSLIAGTLTRTNLQSAPFDFDKAWEIVDSLKNEGLPREAAKQVVKILEEAQKTNNEVQIIKAHLVRIALWSLYQENVETEAITSTQKLIEKSQNRSRSVLHMVKARLLYSYFNQRQWEISQRLSTSERPSGDIREWSPAHFADSIAAHYLASIKDETALFAIPARDWAAILDTNPGSPIFRPTLLDIIAWEALEYFKNEEIIPGRPVSAFQSDHPALLGPLEDFNRLNIPALEGESNTKEAFRIFQRLSRLHSAAGHGEALIHLTLNRLDFAFAKSHSSDKDSLLLSTLHSLANTFKGQAASAWVLLRLADLSDEKGNPVLALKYCEEALSVHPHPYAEYQIRRKIENLKKTELNISCEPAVYTSTPSLLSISWKNAEKGWFRIYKYTENERNNTINPTQEQLGDFILKNKSIFDAEIVLPDPKDFKIHSTEWAMPPLENGFYLLVLSSGNKFEPSKEKIATTTMRVSRLNMATQNQSDGHIRLLAADRKTGQPIANAIAKLYANRYNYRQRIWEKRLIQQTLTNKLGEAYFSAVKEKEWNNYVIELTKNNDTLFFKNIYVQPEFLPKKKSFQQLYLFSDRAIYRPGQTMFYKGIVISRKGNEAHLVKSRSVKIKLIDVNGREVASAVHLTNTFGSFSGSFPIPATGLNGIYTLVGDEGSLSVSVEDYKRPLFEVNLETTGNQYKTGEKVEINGIAKAYAGYSIGEAKVKYRVMRVEYHPWNMWWRRPIAENEQQVAEGESITNADGRFVINFKALGKRDEYYRYRVEVSVTDLNGETRQAVHQLFTGPISLFITLTLPQKVEIKHTGLFTLATTNLEGKPVVTQGLLSVYFLRQPPGIQSKRPFAVPDRPMIPKSEFETLFPNIPIGNEQEFSHWQSESEIKRISFNTQQPVSFSLSELNINRPGVYKIVFKSIDAFGQPVENTQYTVAFDATSKELPYRTDFWFTPLDDTCEPGDNARIVVGTAYGNIRALVQVSLPGKIIKEEWVKLNRSQKNLNIPILEEYRGNLSFHILFFAENKIFSRQHIIQVPFTHKKLQIVTESLRQSTEPGAEEIFNFKIYSADGSTTKAEALAVMYDASLDAFRRAEWNFFPYTPHTGFLTWRPHQQWKNSYLLEFKGNEPYFEKIPTLGFDQINFFGYPTLIISEVPRVYAQDYSRMLKTLSVAESDNKILFQEESKPNVPERPEEGGQEKTIPREDFRETAFFYPHLEPSLDGNLNIQTRMPEALTRWKIRLLAHDTTVGTGYYETTIETRKPLMVVPNPPRFMHTGDTLDFPTKIVNLTEQPLEVKVSLELKNTITDTHIPRITNDTIKIITIAAGESQNVSWKLKAPDQPGLISYHVLAKAGRHSDGVLAMLPILSSRKPTINTWPLYIPANSEKIVNTGIKITPNSPMRLTLEITSNPAWYVLQALPWFDEPQWESAQAWHQTWYIQKLGLHILQNNPSIRKTIEVWKNFQPEALQSPLFKNKDLKNIDLQETPYFNDARDENLRKARLALWVDKSHMEELCNRSLNKLRKLQLPNGGFSWFKGMPDSHFITLEIVKGFARLNSYGALNPNDLAQVKSLLTASMHYLDDREWDAYQEALKQMQKKGETDIKLTPLTTYWLYVRALWNNEFPLNEKYQAMHQHYLKLMREAWKSMPISQQGMIAIILAKNNETQAAERILRSLRDRAIQDPIKGMYWARPHFSKWYESGIFTQALMIEAFTLAGGKAQEIEAIKQWLIFNKRTQLWDNNTASLDAIAALMLRGANPLDETTPPHVEIGGRTLPINQLEAGTVYFKKTLKKEDIGKDIDPIRISNPGRSQRWVGIYAQFETEMDESMPIGGGLNLRKELYVEKLSAEGLQLVPVGKTLLMPGDRLVVRLVVDNSQSMEYVHLKDYHAAGTEPLDVISGYRWQEGTGFYQSTRDETTHFFINFLSEGKHIFEYRLNVSQQGSYTSGFAEIQCQYAPEFSARSASRRIRTGP